MADRTSFKPAAKCFPDLWFRAACTCSWILLAVNFIVCVTAAAALGSIREVAVTICEEPEVISGGISGPTALSCFATCVDESSLIMGERIRDCFLDGCNTSTTCSGCISASATLAYNLSQRYLASSIDVTYARRLMLEDRVLHDRRRAAQVEDELSCACANLTTCCVLWSGQADPGYDCDVGPRCNAKKCSCPSMAAARPRVDQPLHAPRPVVPPDTTLPVSAVPQISSLTAPPPAAGWLARLGVDGTTRTLLRAVLSRTQGLPAHEALVAAAVAGVVQRQQQQQQRRQEEEQQQEEQQQQWPPPLWQQPQLQRPPHPLSQQPSSQRRLYQSETDKAYINVAVASMLALLGSRKIDALFGWLTALGVLGMLPACLALSGLGNRPPRCFDCPSKVERMHKVEMRCACHCDWIIGVALLLFTAVALSKFQILLFLVLGQDAIPGVWGYPGNVAAVATPCAFGIIAGLMSPFLAMILSRSRAERRDAMAADVPIKRYKKTEGKELTAPRPVLRGKPPNPAMLNPVVEQSYAGNYPAVPDASSRARVDQV